MFFSISWYTHRWKLLIAKMKWGPKLILFLFHIFRKKIVRNFVLLKNKRSMKGVLWCQKLHYNLLSKISNDLSPDKSTWSPFNFVKRKEMETMRHENVFVTQSFVIHCLDSGKYTKKTAPKLLRWLLIIPATHLLRDSLLTWKRLGKLKY